MYNPAFSDRRLRISVHSCLPFSSVDTPVRIPSVPSSPNSIGLCDPLQENGECVFGNHFINLRKPNLLLPNIPEYHFLLLLRLSQVAFPLCHFFQRFIGKTCSVFSLTIPSRVWLQQKHCRLFLINTVINTILVSRNISLIMFNLLHSEDMRRQFMASSRSSHFKNNSRNFL